jgi:hypothetical protein
MSKGKEKLLALLFGLGIVFFAWHLKLPSSIQWVFMPWIGICLLVVAMVTTLNVRGQGLDLGDKKIWIPLAVISCSVAFSGIEGFLEDRIVIQEAFADIVLGIFLFGIYLTARRLGNSIFEYMPIVVIVESISVIIVGILNHWNPNGGLYSFTNYDIATGLLIFGVLVSPIKYQWWLSTFAVVALFFTGSAEAIFVFIVFLPFIFLRRDWSWKIAVPASALAIVILVTTLTGTIVSIQAPTLQRIQLVNAMIKGESTLSLVQDNPYLRAVNPNNNVISNIDRVIGFRITHTQLTIPIKPFGYGINLTKFYWGIPHNIVLIIIEQVGILAMLAWVFIALYMAKVSKWHYAWIGLIALGVFDHFIWTQAAIWMPALLGVSSVNNRNDLIFREIK